MMARHIAAIVVVALGLVVAVFPAGAQQATPQPAQAAGGDNLVPIAVAIDLLERAGQAYEAGDYEQAVQAYSLFILLNPTFSQAYYLRGLTYSQLNDVEHALADLTRALVYPQASQQVKALIYNDRALLHLMQDDVEAALDDLDASIAAAPDLPDPYARRAQVYLFAERYEDALADFDTLIELAPDYAPGYAGRAVTHLSLGDEDAAIEDYDRLIVLEPQSAGAYANRSLLHAGNGDYELALADLNVAIRLLPNDASLYLQRGAVNAALENAAEAAADYLDWIERVQTRSVRGDPLLPGESQVLAMENGLSYRLPFEAAAGQTVSLSATARPNVTTDPIVVLLDTTGSPVAGDDDSGGHFDARISEYLVPADGIYTLILSHAGGGADGPVRVLLQIE